MKHLEYAQLIPRDLPSTPPVMESLMGSPVNMINGASLRKQSSVMTQFHREVSENLRKRKDL